MVLSAERCVKGAIVALALACTATTVAAQPALQQHRQRSTAAYLADDLPAALAAAHQAIAAVKRGTPEHVHALRSAGDLLEQLGRHREAWVLRARELEVAHAVFGAEHAEHALSLANAASTARQLGRFPAAIEQQELASAIVTRTSGADSVLHARHDRASALLLSELGDDIGAEKLARLAVAAGDGRVLIEAEIDMTLGVVLTRRGKLGEASERLERALDVLRGVFGRTHPRAAEARVALAPLLRLRGDHVRAERHAMLAVETLAATVGTESATLAPAYLEWALLLVERADHERAEALLSHALRLATAALDGPHPLLARLHMGRAHALAGTGDHAGAREQLEAAARVLAALPPLRAGAPPHPLVAHLDRARAQAALARGDAKGAIAHAEAARAGFEAHGDLVHAALVRADHAAALLAAGQPGQAAAAYRVALEALSVHTLPGHPAIAAARHGLGVALAHAGDKSAAHEALLAAAEQREAHLGELGPRATDAHRQAYLADIGGETDALLDLLLAGALPGDAGAILALTTVLRRKGRALDEQSASVTAMRRRFNASDQHGLAKLSRLRAEHAELVVNGPRGLPMAEYAAQRGRLQAELRRLDETLGLRSSRVRVPLRIEAVRAALPAGAALLEYARFEGREGPRFAAFVLTATGAVQARDLGPAGPIERAVAVTRGALSSPEGAWREPARALYDLVIGPLEPVLAAHPLLLLAPDGALNLVPFAALVDPRGQLLLERATLGYLTSGRDLLRFALEASPRQPPVVLANPAFGERSAAALGPRTALSRASFPPLPGTAGEAELLRSLLPDAIVHVGPAASEGALRSVTAPAILHVATHGFFLGEPGEATPGTRALELEVVGAAPAESAAETLPIADPLLRSGLALTGANARRGAGGDGVMTAAEVATLDLSGTRLVTLSACETGVGEARAGDGVYGLRRALVVAGAQTQVMSLWKVDDDATAALMAGYYRAIVQQGRGRAEAMQEVQRTMLGQEATAHPYYWAAFLVSGSPAPLETSWARYLADGLSARALTVPPGAGCGCRLSPDERPSRWLLPLAFAVAALRVRRSRG